MKNPRMGIAHEICSWEKVNDITDCFEVVYPELQLVLEVGHSASHGKKREDRLYVP